MSDSYLMDSGALSSVISSLNKDITSYQEQIDILNHLVEEINGSSAWKDVQVKTAFIETCQGYITKYSNLITAMNQFVNYLSGKESSGNDIESAFAGG